MHGTGPDAMPQQMDLFDADGCAAPPGRPPALPPTGALPIGNVTDVQRPGATAWPGAPDRPPPRSQPRHSVSNVPPDPVPTGLVAIKKESVDAGRDAALAGPDHRVLLRGVSVGWWLQRARRRSIGLLIGDAGLVVRAPRWVTLGQIESVLQERAGWILAKLDALRARQQRRRAARVHWGPQARLPYLGQPLLLVADPQAPAGGLLEPAESADAPHQLRLALAAGDPPERWRAAAQRWLQRQARRHFTERLDHFAPKLAVRWKRLALSSATTRWGSASTSGAIRLNWRLMHLSPALVDYVVVHELAHLRVMDHSPRFWAAVAEVLPDHRALRRALREAELPDWGDGREGPTADAA